MVPYNLCQNTPYLFATLFQSTTMISEKQSAFRQEGFGSFFLGLGSAITLATIWELLPADLEDAAGADAGLSFDAGPGTIVMGGRF